MGDQLFALVLIRLKYRQANLQSRLAPFPVMGDAPASGHGLVKIFQFHLERTTPVRTWHFSSAVLVVNENPVRRLPQRAALATD